MRICGQRDATFALAVRRRHGRRGDLRVMTATANHPGPDQLIGKARDVSAGTGRDLRVQGPSTDVDADPATGSQPRPYRPGSDPGATHDALSSERPFKAFSSCDSPTRQGDPTMSAQSPIDPERLRRCWPPRWGSRRTLPAEAYTSQAVFDWEVEHFFEGGWVCVGRTDDLADARRPEARSAIGDEGILVVRDLDGNLQGFYNTCRHRGHELLEPGTSRNLRAIKCPYHAWVYQLDGSLGAAPRFGDLDGLRQDRLPADRGPHPGVARAGSSSTPTARRRTSIEYVGNLDELIARLGVRAPVRGRHARVRDRRELEDDHGELPRVLPLPVDPPGAVRGHPARLRRELPARRTVGGRLDGAEGLRGDDVAHGRVGRRAGSAA